MNTLTPEEEAVIERKHTEPPFVGEYYQSFEDGIYVCRRCDNPLFSSETKFHSDCGWPSFDDHFKGAVKEIPDADGYRIEIICAQCGGHLGHVFTGEKSTEKDTRHCVNSLSIKFVPQTSEYRMKAR